MEREAITVRIDILTLFPEMFAGPFDSSIIRRAVDAGVVSIDIHNIRGYTHDRHHTADDYPYGGGAGMVMKPEPVFEAAESVAAMAGQSAPQIVLLTPQGELFNQNIAVELANSEYLMLICGHYEGVDERIRQYLVTREISIGDYVVSGGELPAMVVLDAVVRLVPGALGSGESVTEESHIEGLLEYPHYTRPPEYRGWAVPEILLSGNHGEIAKWRRRQSLLRTLHRRPDLLGRAELDKNDRRFLQEQAE